MSSSSNIYRTRTRTRLEAAAETFLPDDIVIDILRRLPSKDVFRYQCVCRKWRDLISTKDFVDLHIQRGLRCTVPMILVEERHKHGKDETFLDKWWVVPARKRAVTHRFDSYPDCSIIFSQEGFLVLNSDYRNEIIVSNPINSEKVRIIVPKSFLCSISVHGMFFNQTLKEYCLLLGVYLRRKWSIDYKILNLGPEPCIRQILNPWHKRSGVARPLVVNEHLYWFVTSDDIGRGRHSSHTDIVEFDTKTEEFRLLRYSIMNTVTPSHFGLDLVNIDGFLSVVQIATRDTMLGDITIWTLKDRAKESWTSSNYCFSWRVHSRYGIPKALAHRDGELIIQYHQRLLVCNLIMGTVRNFGRKSYNTNVSFFSHITNLASLRNCKSKICMEGEDEKWEVIGLSL